MNQQFTSCALGECGSYLFFEAQIFNPDILFRLFGGHVAFCLHIYMYIQHLVSVASVQQPAYQCTDFPRFYTHYRTNVN